MKKGIYIVLAVVFSACSQSEEKHDEKVSKVDTKVETPKVESKVSVPNPSEADTTIAVSSGVGKKYNGSWFSVEIPTGFSASPLSPEKHIDNYSFVETDEARFTSPDGTVEFFIYSPQWSGNPKDYLVQQSNEKIVDGMEETNLETSHRWGTFEDKDGKYTRAYHSIRTESTHHVFGVKYTDKKSYERYKAKYMAFKKSLQQYAD